MSDDELQQALRDALDTLQVVRVNEDWIEQDAAVVVERTADAMAYAMERWRELEIAAQSGVILPPHLPEG